MSARKPRSARRLTAIEKVDIELARRVALDKRGKAARAVARFAEFGDQPPLIALSAGVVALGALRRDERLARTGLRMLAAHSLTTIAKHLGKGSIDRTRPDDALRESRYRLEEGDSQDGRLGRCLRATAQGRRPSPLPQSAIIREWRAPRPASPRRSWSHNCRPGTTSCPTCWPEQPRACCRRWSRPR